MVLWDGKEVAATCSQADSAGLFLLEKKENITC